MILRSTKTELQNEKSRFPKQLAIKSRTLDKKLGINQIMKSGCVAYLCHYTEQEWSSSFWPLYLLALWVNNHHNQLNYTISKFFSILFYFIFFLQLAMPKNLVVPRLPTLVYMRGNYQRIPEDKIVGGTNVKPNSLPFQISLQRRSAAGTYSQSCGGSILDANVILDAAHCVNG